jgi:phosphonate transport system substrate-binding protein
MKFSFPAGAALIASAILAASAVAQTDWRNDQKVLRVGVLAGTDAAYRIALLEPFRAYLEAKIALPVEIVPVGSYAALIDAQTGARIHYAIHSAASFATAAEQCQCVEAVGAPLAASGALGFYSILVSRADGPIRSLDDAADKRIALTGADSIAGRLLPMKALADAGINPSGHLRVVEARDPEAAIRSLLAGEVDLAAGWASMTGSFMSGFDFGVLAKMVAEGALDMKQVRIVWQSNLIPFGPHAVRSDLPAELKTLVTGALGDMATENPDALDAVDRLGFGGGGFATPTPDLYAVVRDLVSPASAATQDERP